MSSNHKIPAIVSGANLIHKQGFTGKGITVALLDSGLANHPDIKEHRILDFRDFVNHSNKNYDDYSHGTHVAGILASSQIGIAPQCNIIPLKILDSNGQCSTDIFIDAIRWILSHQNLYHIRIINISIGGNVSELKQEKNRLNRWVSKLWEQGMIVCCSAGNNGPLPDSIAAPGNCKEVITVGSYDGKYFSSAGPKLPYVSKPELSAPGFHILSLNRNNGYTTKNGTSMSVPFISGICALFLQKYPYLTNEQVKYYLMNSANALPHIPRNIQGAGMVDLQKLMQISARNLQNSFKY